MRNTRLLLLFLLTAVFTFNLYAADDPEIKYDEAWAIKVYNRGNYKMAFQIFEKAAALNHATAQYYLGRMYFNGEVPEQDIDYDKAFE